MKRILSLKKSSLLVGLVGLIGLTKASAQVESLWITEVVPSTGQIEVTNVSDAEIVAPNNLPFCHRFNYATSVPSGTVFAPGQSRIYTVSFRNQAASDLWIYSESDFDNSDALLNGLTWGAAPIGRTGVAVNGNNWDAITSFAPTPPVGQALQLTGPDPFSAANWTVGAPDLGNFELPATGQIEDLWITEVVPSTGQIEVTNVSDVEIVAPNNLPFCHRFNYATSVPSGTVFAPGQSRIYTVSFRNQAASDLWIYSESDFDNSDALLNGLTWGAAPIGRTGVAVNGNNWDAITSFAPTPPVGQALQLTGPDPFSAANWTVGTPDLGNFGPSVEPFVLSLDFDGDTANLTWTGGEPPYLVESSTDLVNYVPASPIIVDTEASIPVSSAERLFFRVKSGVEIDQQATFRVRFVSFWSGLAFASVPPNPTFTALTGSTHNDAVNFWEPGANASEGVALLAESSASNGFQSEINIAALAGNSSAPILGSSIDEELGESSFEFTADSSMSLLTLVSRMAPSPDWFTGVQNLQLRESDGVGDWAQTIEVELRPYDAGTNGEDSAIFSLEGAAAFGPSLFLDSSTPPQPIGGLVIERVTAQ